MYMCVVNAPFILISESVSKEKYKNINYVLDFISKFSYDVLALENEKFAFVHYRLLWEISQELFLA